MMQAVLWSVLKLLIVLTFILLNAMLLIWLERKVSAWIQLRLGPMRVGRPQGWAQSIADVLKLLFKEDIVPSRVDKVLFVLGPIIAFMPALMVWAVIPFGPNFVSADLNIGVLYIAAIGSIGLMSIFTGGWGSNNKWSLISAMRSAAQLFSYEVPLVLALIGVVMLAGSLSLTDIIRAQQETAWYILYQPLGFLVFLIAGIAEVNRTPFDLSEAESELVAGWHVEYSGLRWAMYFLAEYGNLLALSALAATLFLGGWTAPFGLDFIPPFVWFLLKTYLFVFVAMWIRWTFPRVRIDQLMDLSWKFLIPVALLNIALTGIGITIFS